MVLYRIKMYEQQTGVKSSDKGVFFGGDGGRREVSKSNLTC